MFENFIKFIEKERLFTPSDRLLVAVSGGLDSMVLTHLLMCGGYSIGLAHFDHVTRYGASEVDARFVRDFAQEHDIPYHHRRRDVATQADAEARNFQELARDLRYAWFESLCRSDGYSAYATAHHRDDAIENFLFRLANGSGIGGLSGIPIRKGQCVRPLLFAHRSDIRAYANENNIEFREDKSNRSDAYDRNYIRHWVLPALRKRFPGFEASASRTIENVRDANDLLNHLMDRHITTVASKRDDALHISRSHVLETPGGRSLLYHILSEYGFNRDQTINAYENNRTGALFQSDTHKVRCEREAWVIRPKSEGEATNAVLVVLEAGQYITPDGTLAISHSDDDVSDDPWMEMVDRATLSFPLTLRRWRPGDRFQPLGMDGRSQKVQDLLTNIKMPSYDKENQLVLEDDAGIIWVVGLRLSHRYRIQPETQEKLRLSFQRS